jgi:hypothetical protein
MNVFHTPSHGSIYRRIHMNLGRVGMAAGLVSVVFGMLALYLEGAAFPKFKFPFCVVTADEPHFLPFSARIRLSKNTSNYYYT